MAAEGSGEYSFEEQNKYIRKIDEVTYEIAPGFVPNMAVPGRFYVNDDLRALLGGELDQYIAARGIGGFVPALKQVRVCVCGEHGSGERARE